MDVIERLSRIGVPALAIVILIAKDLNLADFVARQPGVSRGAGSSTGVKDEEVRAVLRRFGTQSVLTSVADKIRARQGWNLAELLLQVGRLDLAPGIRGYLIDLLKH